MLAAGAASAPSVDGEDAPEAPQLQLSPDGEQKSLLWEDPNTLQIKSILVCLLTRNILHSIKQLSIKTS